MDFSAKKLSHQLSSFLYESADSGYKELGALQVVVREAFRGNRHLPDRLRAATYRFFDRLIGPEGDFGQVGTTEKIQQASIFAGLFKSNTLGDSEPIPCDLFQLAVGVRGASQIVACLPATVFNTSHGKKIIWEFFRELGVSEQPRTEPTCKLFLAFGTAREAQFWWISLRNLLRDKLAMSDENIEIKLTKMYRSGFLKSVIVGEFASCFKVIVVNPQEGPNNHFLIFPDENRPDQGIRYGGFADCGKWLDHVYYSRMKASDSEEYGPEEAYGLNHALASQA